MEEHDSTYKSSKISFDDSEPGNRRILAATSIPAGEMLLQETFRLVAAYAETYTKTCHFCLVEPLNPKRCTGCKYAHYCNADHQMKDWKRGHKKECAIFKGISNFGERHPTAPLAIVVKMFVQIDLLNNTTFRDELLQLKSHADKMEPVRHEELKGNVVLTIKYSDNNFDLERIHRYVDLLDRILVNGVTVYSQRNPALSLAMGLLRQFCRVNHSCDPNCYTSFNIGSGMRIVNAKPIAKGEELTISYVNQLDYVHVRKEKLKKEYFFDCACSKCKTEESKEKLVSTTSVGVEQVVSKDIEPMGPKTINLSKPTKSELTRTLSTREECLVYLKEMSSRLSEYDYEWATVIDNLEYVLVELKELKVLYDLRLKFTKKYEHWFGNGQLNPIVGQHYNNLGRLANQLDLPEETLEYCTKAFDTLKPFFTGELLVQLKEMIEDSRAFLELQKGSLGGGKA